MTKLCPAAQAVLDAFNEGSTYYDDIGPANIAAALRAAANQGKAMEIPFSVVNDWENVKGSCASFYAAAEWGYFQALKEQRAIADELEAQ
jgi:hypothetical protein